MSDISTTLSMNGGQLFTQTELLTCSMFNLKMFLFVLTILICISCISSLMTPILPPPPSYKENFSNNLFFSDKDTMNPGYSNYQSTPLTSNNNSLIFGQANRYVNANKDSVTQLNYILDIYANLYVLNGNPFGSSQLKVDSLNQKYAVYLKNTKTSDKLEIGKLKKDGDGMYKMHFVSSDPVKYMHFNEVEIIYETLDKKISLLQGKLTIV